MQSESISLSFRSAIPYSPFYCYLAAHTSKSKQEQLGWKGHQWGKINGSLLDLDEPIRVKLPRTQADTVYRSVKRLTRTRFASSHGRQTWFVHPDTVKRLCEWVTGNYTPVRILGCTAFKPFKKDRKDRKKVSGYPDGPIHLSKQHHPDLRSRILAEGK